MTRALYPGSFDPVHLGHLDVVEACAALFDEIVVVAMYNPEKPAGFFTLEEREELLTETFAHLENVSTTSSAGLVVQAAAQLGADVVIKGVRSAGDLDVEVQMAHTNKAVSGIQTLLVPAEPANAFVSSRYIREITARGEDVTALVPAPVGKRLMAKTASLT